MDSCPSTILLGQTISDLLRYIFGEVHMCHSRCVSMNNEGISGHSQFSRLGNISVCVEMSDPNFSWVEQNTKMVGQCLNADHYF